MAMKKKSFVKKLLRDERGAVAIVMTVYLPFIVGLFTLATDMSYVLFTRNQLQVTAEAAALAGSTQLPDKTAAITMTKQYVEKNMPAARFGTVVKDADIIVGKWTTGCSGSKSCFTAAGAADCAAIGCNAIQVTAQLATSNGNALALVFAPMIGMGSFDVGATAIATFGPGPSSGATWNVVVVEDISMSF